MAYLWKKPSGPMFSKACEYGIKAIIHISHQSQNGKRVSLKEVASAIDSPVAFTAKILQSLANHHIVSSTKGPSGGYEVSPKDQEGINLFQIVEAIDGDHIFHGCGLGLEQCTEEMPCPIHESFKKVRENMKTMLCSSTIKDLALGIEKGNSYLKC